MILGLSQKTRKVLIYPVIIKLKWNMASELKIKCDDEYHYLRSIQNEVINVVVRKCHHW